VRALACETRREEAAVTNDEIWVAVHEERRALAADLEGLSDEQWAHPSACPEWTVRDVVAHMTAAASMTPVEFFGKFIGSGFSFDKLQAKDIARERGGSNADTLVRFKAQVTSKKHPPGPTLSWLGEALVHGEDVRRPLGLTRAYPVAPAAAVAGFYKGSNLLIGSKKRIAGLRLKATDTDWSTGDGPEVSGPIVALVLAMTGRKVASDLSGDGAAVLASRP
jgi:uncharacterized protein (TIGR03083 family)